MAIEQDYTDLLKRADEQAERFQIQVSNQIDVINRMIAANKAHEPWTYDQEMAQLHSNLAETQRKLALSEKKLKEALRYK